MPFFPLTISYHSRYSEQVLCSSCFDVVPITSLASNQLLTTLRWWHMYCLFLFHARLFISFLACHSCLYPFHVILTCCGILPSRVSNICCTFLIRIHFLILIRLEPRVAALGQSHTVFDVVVMSSMLDYYLSCLFHCIAAEHIIHSDSMLSLVRNDLY